MLRSVVIVDDDRLFADALRLTLEDVRIPVVGIAGTVEEGRAIARATRPTLVLIDLGMPDLARGAEAIRKERIDTVLFGLVPRKLTSTSFVGGRPGLDGYVSKEASTSMFLDALEAVLQARVGSGANDRHLAPRTVWAPEKLR